MSNPRWTSARSAAGGTRSARQEPGRARFGLPRHRVEELAESQLAFLPRRRERFDRRVREGRIVESHGDLRPEHSDLIERPVIIDCCEFPRQLRILDPADKVSFLALERERLGHPIGRWSLETCTEVTDDAPPEPLVRFSRNHRLMRRARIAL